MNDLHTHRFIEEYDGMVGFGFDRPTNEKTVMYYLQKFSDDALLETLIPRLDDNELETLFEMLSGFMARHLKESEYHRLFLKEDREE